MHLKERRQVDIFERILTAEGSCLSRWEEKGSLGGRGASFTFIIGWKQGRRGRSRWATKSMLGRR